MKISYSALSILSSILALSLLFFSFEVSAQKKLDPLDPLDLAWLEKQLAGVTTEMTQHDAYLFKSVCRRGGGIEPTYFDIERLRKKGAGKKVLSFLEYRKNRKTNAKTINPCKVTNVLLADFYNVDESDASDHRYEITSEIRKELIRLAIKFPDINIISLKRSIMEEERGEVDEIARQYDSTIVIWGNYTIVEDVTKINAWVEVKDYYLAVTSELEVKQAGNGFRDLKLQGDMAHDLKIMMLLAMGLISSRAGDIPVANAYFSEVDQPDVPERFRFFAVLCDISAKWRSRIFDRLADIRDMIDRIEPLLEIEPESTDAHRLLLEMYGRIDSAKAIEHGEKAVELARSVQDQIDAHIALTNFYSQITHLDKTLETGEKAVKLLLAQKDTIENKFDLINIYERLGKTEKANEESEKVILRIAKNKSADVNDFFRKALLEVKLGRFDDMEKSLIRALQMKPAFTNANVLLSLHYWGVGKREKEAKRPQTALVNFKKALTFADRVLEYEPTYIDAILSKAQTYNAMDDIRNATHEYERALAIDPVHITTNLGVSNMYSSRKDYKTAIKYISAAIVAGEAPVFLNERARFYIENGQNDLGLKDIIRCHELLSADLFKWRDKKGNQVNLSNVKDFFEIFNEQAELLYLHKDFDSALVLCDTVIKFYADMDSMHEKKAWFLYSKAKISPEKQQPTLFREALKEADRAVEMNVEGAVNYTIRSAIHFRLGETEKANSDADKVIDLKVKESGVKDSDVYYTEASYIMGMGEVEIAIMYMEQGLAIDKVEARKKEIKELIELIKANKDSIKSSQNK